MSSFDKELLLLGKNIKRLRKDRGLTQEQLAELCEFDPTYISLLERGKRNPPFSTLIKIALVLEISVSALTHI